MGKTPAGIKPIARNRRAFHDFQVLEQVEAGVVLKGAEVKSLRLGNVSFSEAHARCKKDGVWLIDLHIAPYKNASGWEEVEPTRPRKLLLHKREIRRIKTKVERQGLTLVPLEMYFKRGYAKVRLGICKGRRKFDKRQVLRKRQDEASMARQARRR
ncbi:MAG: SsrA-binding protein SmpB [Planctomycetota bacterium]|jgi:SsrA-binding protein